ncbi:MAG: glycosyltransferase family 2 protein [Patescibacteria group bacterium]
MPTYPQKKDVELSILIPCFNEEKAVVFCLDQIKETIKKNNLSAEVICVDNASTDRTKERLQKYKESFEELQIVSEPVLGYGSAYLRGFNIMQGKYIFMADCDGTYNFKEIPLFLEKLRDGSDLVVGNRFHSKLESGVMPWLHRVIGNPLLSFITKLFFKIEIHDIHCGARAISRKALEKITLYTKGMEFASEMIIKCARQNLKIVEIPVSYHKRIGKSKLNSFSDGWRHLRFLLLYSPLFLFFIPGIILFIIGLLSLLAIYFFEIKIFGIQLYFHPMFLSSLILSSGYQLIFFAGFARTYAITHLGDHDSFLEPLYKKITIEKAGLLGLISITVGCTIYIYIFVKWIHSGFGSLDEIKNSIVALTLLTLGIQTFFSAFMLSILGIKEK